MATKNQEPKEREPKALYTYKGPDEFPGIPARDLTQDDFDDLPILRQLDVKASAAYELVKASESKDGKRDG